MQNKKIKNNNYILRDYLLAAVLCALAMLIYVFSIVIKDGNTLFTGDLLELYLPAIKSVADNIRNGQGLSFSWNLYMGMDAVEYYVSVAGGSLWNLLYLLFPMMEPESFIIISIVGKCALAGVTFTYFSKRVLKAKLPETVIFSLFYALCGFQVVINSVNIIWMDQVYLLPLILTGIVIFLEEKKWKMLVISYAYSFLCNFYIAYIVGIFSAVFFLLYLFLFTKKDVTGSAKIKKMAVYGGMVILAAGLMAWALFPTAKFILNNPVADATPADGSLVTQNLFLLLERFLFGISFGEMDRLPYLYCGLLTVLLLPFFFYSKRIEKREKILYGSLLFLLLLSCMCLPLYLLWHGFDAPDQWYGRFTFCFSFLCTAMGCRICSVYDDESTKEKNVIDGQEAEKTLKDNGTVSSWVVIIISAVCMLLLLAYGKGYTQTLSNTAVLWNVVFLIGWLIIMVIRRFCKGKEKNLLSFFAISLAFFEVIGNGCLQHTLYQSRSEIESMYIQNEFLAKALQEDTGLYRVEVGNAMADNIDSLGGYPGVTDFCSFENYQLRQTMRKLGSFTSPRLLSSRGIHPLTEMLLGVKYNALFATPQEYTGKNPLIYRNPLYISMGFMVDEAAKAVELGEDNVFENSNRVATALLGKEIALFEPVAEENVRVEERGIRLTKEENGYRMTREADTPDQVALNYEISGEEREVYVAFAGQKNVFEANSPIVYEYSKVADYGALDVTYAKRMDKLESQSICTITMIRDWTRDEGSYTKAYFYALNEQVLQELYEKLSEEKLEILDWKNGYIHGKIKVSDASKILFTSIPNVEGWKITVKNSEVQTTADHQQLVEVTPLLEGTFLGLEFPHEGEYEVDFTYEAPGLQQGIIISVLSLVIFLSLLLGEKIYFARKYGRE